MKKYNHINSQYKHTQCHIQDSTCACVYQLSPSSLHRWKTQLILGLSSTDILILDVSCITKQLFHFKKVFRVNSQRFLKTRLEYIYLLNLSPNNMIHQQWKWSWRQLMKCWISMTLGNLEPLYKGRTCFCEGKLRWSVECQGGKSSHMYAIITPQDPNNLQQHVRRLINWHLL